MGLFGGGKKSDDEGDSSDADLAQRVLDKEEEDRKKREAAAAEGKRMADIARPDEMKAPADDSIGGSLGAEAGKAYGKKMADAATPDEMKQSDPFEKDMSKWQSGANDLLGKTDLPDANGLPTRRVSYAGQVDKFGAKPEATTGVSDAGYYDTVKKGLDEVIKGGPAPHRSQDWVDAKGNTAPAAKTGRQLESDPSIPASDKMEVGRRGPPSQEDIALAKQVQAQEARRKEANFKDTGRMDLTNESGTLQGGDYAPGGKKGGTFSVPGEVAKLFTGATGYQKGDAAGARMVANANPDAVDTAPSELKSNNNRAMVTTGKKEDTQTSAQAATAAPAQSADQEAADVAFDNTETARRQATMEGGARPTTPTPGTDWGDVASNAYETGKGMLGMTATNGIPMGAPGGPIGRGMLSGNGLSEDGLKSDAGYLAGGAQMLPSRSEPQAPGIPAPPAQQQQAVPQQGGSMSARAQVQVPNVNAPDVPQIPYVDKELADASAKMQQFVKHQGELNRTQLQEEAKLSADVGARQSLDQQRFQGQQEAVQAGQRKAESDIAEASKVMADPIKTPNPERYWENHSKIMFAIGVGLLAQAGKDIGPVLSNVNAAIDRDIEQQKQQFEAPNKAAAVKMKAAESAYGRYRNAGYDSFEAEKMAAIQLKAYAANKATEIAANSGAASAQNAADMLMQGMSQKVLEDHQAMVAHANANTIAAYSAKEKAFEDRSKNAIGVAEFNSKEADKRAGAGAGKGLSDKDARTLADNVAGLDELTKAGKIFKSGLGSAVYNELTGLDPTATTDAAAFNANRPMYKRILAALMSPDERKNETMMRDVMGMVPEAGDADAKPRWDSVLRFIRQRTGAEAAAESNTPNKTAQVNRITGGGQQAGGQVRVGPDGKRYYVEP